MAQGIEWYRAHHGTVTDPKFAVVAKRAGQHRGDVIAMWHLLMEDASAAADRGNPGAPDFETIDDLLGMAEGGAEAIYEAFIGKGLIIRETGRLEAWDRRQPKREREDNSAADRKRAQRARDAAADEQVTDDGATFNHPQKSHDASRHVTPDDSDVTPREEKRREEKEKGAKAPSSAAAPPTVPNCPHLKLLALFSEKVPELPHPKPELWDGAKADDMRQRWRWLLTAVRSSGDHAGERYATNEAEGLAWFARFFDYVHDSDFLTGRDGAWRGCSLEWLVNKTNFGKVVQGHYKNKETA